MDQLFALAAAVDGLHCCKVVVLTVGCSPQALRVTNDIHQTHSHTSSHSAAVSGGGKGDAPRAALCRGGILGTGENMKFWNSAASGELAFASQNRLVGTCIT